MTNLKYRNSVTLRRMVTSLLRVILILEKWKKKFQSAAKQF